MLDDIQLGFASGRHNSEGEGIPHLRPMNVSSHGRINLDVVKYIDPALANRSERRLRKGDVLFNNTNSPELVGKTAVFDGDGEPAFSNHITRLRPDPNLLDPAYLARRLHFAWMEGYFAARCNNHVSQASIGRAELEDMEIEVPPILVQRSLGRLLDELEARRLSAASRLAASRLAIVRFRQAVLAAACSGRLTEDWRERYPNSQVVGPALGRLPRTRRRRNSTEQGIKLELPDLPDGYIVTTIGEAAVMLEYGTSKRADASPEDGVPVLRMGNIQDGRLDLSDLKYCRRDSEVERLLLGDGDLLFNRTNSPELVGKCAVFHGSEPMSFASYLIRIRLAPDVAEPNFVNYWINSAWGRTWARLAKTDGVSQSNINGSKLALMPLPLPPIEEQRLIVARVSHMLNTANHLVENVERVALGVEESGRSILARAFRGDLTPLNASRLADRSSRTMDLTSGQAFA